MSELTGRNRPLINRSAKRGQALIIVLAVMFVLLFIGTIFIATIGRNIQQSGRSVDTQIANTLAEAGLQYCKDQLVHSGDGADWRPAPTPALSLTDPDYQWLAEGFSRVSLNGGRALIRVVYNPQSGDPRGGMLRLESIGRPGDIGDGTDPTIFVATGAAPRLRKELLAYMQIGLTDYVLFVTNKNKTNVEAAIGAPDLGIPTPTGAQSIGAPLSLVIGDPTVKTGTGVSTPSSPMRINSDVRFYGSTYLYESYRGTNDNLLTADTLLASGNIVFDNANSRLFVNDDLSTNPAPLTTASDVLTGVGGKAEVASCAANPTSANPDCAFDSRGGLVRTGSDQPDIKGYSQGIRALTPPSLDYYDLGSGFLRYRLLTRETGAFDTDASGNGFRVGQLGWGTGIYINNPTDYQAETNAAGIGSSYSLRADWLNPKANFSQGSWQGPYYNPPGVTIELLGDSIRFTRDDNETFYEPDGSPSVEQGGKSITIPLSDYERIGYVLKAGNNPKFPLAPFPHDGDEITVNNFKDSGTYGVNVVIMAEGNVRVRGVYGVDASNVTEAGNVAQDGSKKLERVHLTIVSGHTAYIDGNIVKGDPDKASTCAILAHDYVCVNTTQFMQPRNESNSWTQYPQDLPSFINEIGPGTSAQNLDFQFSFGIDPGQYNVGPKLLVRNASYHGAPTLMNLLINPALSQSSTYNKTGFYDFSQSTFPGAGVMDQLQAKVYTPDGLQSGGATSFPETYALGYTYGSVNANGVAIVGDFAALPKIEARSFPLNIGAATYELLTKPGYENLLRFQSDSTTAGQTGTSSLLAGGSDDYAFGGAIVTPLDIRIEAMLYAQERSFFVIPGYPFNPDRSDTPQSYAHNLAPNATAPGGLGPSRPLTYGSVSRVAPDFPFYNEPLDVRITLYGSIAENYTASMSDQAAWMARWGYIPVNSGASTGATIPTIHISGTDPGSASGDYRTLDEVNAGIARGLRYQYDPALALPYKGNAGGAPPLRSISYVLKLKNGTPLANGNLTLTLPAIPKLPVCPDFLYEGTPDKPL